MAGVHARLLPLLDRSQDGWNLERVFACAASEIAAELRLSQHAAERELDHALRLQHLPAVAARLRAGELDRVRVVVLLETCTDLSQAHRDQLLSQVLPGAGTLTAAKLKARAQRVAIALDPGWAERRYREAIRRRRVVRYLNEDGTV